MKIKVESEKIIRAVKKLEGIEIVLENPEDAKEALNLILRKTKLSESQGQGKLKEPKVTALQHYETSAVDYKMVFLLEFLFEETASSEERVEMIKEIQEFFKKV
jgi:hypothetical protein